MKLSAVFPTTEIGSDPVAIRDWTQAIEDLGYEHILFSDHIVGGNPEIYPQLRNRNNAEVPYHEPFVTMGYMAGFTKRIKLVTGILILPMRQTALVAKQAAEVDVLTGGRLILGYGVGNDRLEYEAMNADFHNRGRRTQEQVEVLRLLWTGKPVTFHGQWHHLSDVALNPAPVQQPIPIWIGGSAERVLQRAGRLADGWIPSGATLDPAQVQVIREAALAAGRDPQDVVIAPRLFNPMEGGVEAWRSFAEHARQAGASVLFLNTRNCGLSGLDEHLDVAKRFMGAMQDLAD